MQSTNNLEYLYGDIKKTFENQQYDLSKKLCEEGQLKYPSEHVFYSFLGNIYCDIEFNFAEGLKLYEQAINILTSDEENFIEGKIIEAILPDYYMLHIVKGLAHEKMFEFSAALNEFASATTILPSNPMGWINKSRIEAFLLNFSESKVSYNKAILINPESANYLEQTEEMIRIGTDLFRPNPESKIMGGDFFIQFDTDRPEKSDLLEETKFYLRILKTRPQETETFQQLKELYEKHPGIKVWPLENLAASLVQITERGTKENKFYWNQWLNLMYRTDKEFSIAVNNYISEWIQWIIDNQYNRNGDKLNIDEDCLMEYYSINKKVGENNEWGAILCPEAMPFLFETLIAHSQNP